MALLKCWDRRMASDCSDCNHDKGSMRTNRSGNHFSGRKRHRCASRGLFWPGFFLDMGMDSNQNWSGPWYHHVSLRRRLPRLMQCRLHQAASRLPKKYTICWSGSAVSRDQLPISRAMRTPQIKNWIRSLKTSLPRRLPLARSSGSSQLWS